MLNLVGIGIKKEHINYEIMELIKNSSKVYLEYYTSFYQDTFEELSKFIGKEIQVVDREFVESKIDEEILEPAKKENITLMVIGDPLIATTHTDLLLRAKVKNIKINICNNVSIGNFITRTGLQFYKFGKVTSIPFFSEKFMPRTPYLIFIDNYKMGAHSLFLLDLNPSNDVAYKGKEKYLKASDALQFLLNIPKIMIENEELEEKESKFIDGDTHALICSRIGFEDEEIVFDTINSLIKIDKHKNFKEPLCLIIPGDLHEMEEKYLQSLNI